MYLSTPQSPPHKSQSNWIWPLEQVLPYGRLWCKYQTIPLSVLFLLTPTSVRKESLIITSIKAIYEK